MSGGRRNVLSVCGRGRIYIVQGIRVYPPKGWKRGVKWESVGDCVKLCKICKEPLWRALGSCPSEWASRLVHAGKCQNEYNSRIAAKKKERQAEKMAKPERVLDKDLEQQRIDHECSMAYVARMWLTPNDPLFRYYFRGAAI